MNPSTIKLNTVAEKNNADMLFVRGQFELNYSDISIDAEGSDVLKHLVLVVTRLDNYQALAPFKDVVVFDVL